MCKIKQLNGDAPRANNYCTAREYEVLTIIAKDETLKVGDLIDGEQLNPAEAVFVDDGPRNIAAAQQLGFHTLCPANGADWRDDLWQLLDRLNGKD